MSALAALVLGAGACTSPQTPSVLDPRGTGASEIARTWWLMLGISAAVFAVVIGYILYAVVRSRRPETEAQPNWRWGDHTVVLGGLVIPAIILTGTFIVSLEDMSVLSSPPEPTAVTVEVVGNLWWWEATYEQRQNAVTANEIHIPVGEPVRVELETDDVIHSFWVPQLQAKTDMISGQVTSMWLNAEEPGRYRGQCAEFCGLQHAQMIFYVVAQPREKFDAWLENQSSPAAEPVSPSERRGKRIFLSSTCAGCHEIRGTPANAQLGPDLTHFADRETLASGAVANTRANLATWILDPQSIKPGATMPPVDLTEDELSSLLDYLESLK